MHDDELGDFCAVERIIKKERNAQTKRLKFLVKFEGYDASENRWLSWYDFSPDMRKIATTMPTTEPESDANF